MAEHECHRSWTPPDNFLTAFSLPHSFSQEIKWVKIYSRMPFCLFSLKTCKTYLEYVVTFMFSPSGNLIVVLKGKKKKKNSLQYCFQHLSHCPWIFEYSKIFQKSFLFITAVWKEYLSLSIWEKMVTRRFRMCKTRVVILPLSFEYFVHNTWLFAV